MEQSELLRYAIGVLEGLGLRYFVTGSVASIYFGEPRFTNDIDIVVDLQHRRIAEFCRAFPTDEFYLSEESVERAVRERGQFNVLHPQTGLKLDIMVPKDTLFARPIIPPSSPAAGRGRPLRAGWRRFRSRRASRARRTPIFIAISIYSSEDAIFDRYKRLHLCKRHFRPPQTSTAV